MESKCRRFALWSLLFSLIGLAPLAGQNVLTGEAEREDGETRMRAAEWSFQQRAYPGNTIPRGYRFAALEELQRSGRQWSPQMAPAGDVTGRWIELGPDNVGGRTLSLAIHPNNDNILYAGLADGGVFKTTDGGVTWVTLNDKLPSLAVKSLVLDPINPEIIYAGTGEGYFNVDAAIGQGVMKSTNGGATWTYSTPFAQYVNRLAIDPSTPRTLYAATHTGIFKSTDANDTWTRVFPNHSCIDLSLDPDNPQVLLTSVWDRPNQSGNGIWRTTDGGASWNRISGGLPEGRLIGRVALARSSSHSRTLYAGVAQVGSSLPVMGIWKSIDGGETWAQFPGTPSYCGSQCWYDSELVVHPSDPDTVFAGGLFLWRSTNGGETWSRSDSGVHVDHHSMAISKRNPNLVYSGNDGGVFRSLDGGTTWSSMNYGLGGTQFYALAISATDPTITYGGTQDNGTQKGSGAAGFQMVLGADGMVPLVDPTDPNFVYAEFQFGGLRRSTNGGISFVDARTGITASDRFNFVTPWTIDPSNAQVLYVGSHRLYKSTNRAENWTVLSSDLTRGGGTISAIAVAPSDAKVIYAGTTDGLVWITTDGGATTESFMRITTGLPNRYVTRLRVHPTNSKIVYATYSGFNNTGGASGHVFKSTDGGENWRSVSSNLPDLPVQVIVIDPHVPSTLFLGTDLGCFRSLDDGATWESFNDGLPNVVVDDMAYFGNTNLLRIATHGRGIWQYTTPGRTTTRVVSIVGNGQRAASGKELAFPVRVAAFDAEGVPVPNAAITFEAPSTGPTGTFADGSNRAEVQSDLFGVANLPKFRLDGRDGTFTITARASGAVTAATVSITSVATSAQITRVEPDSAVAGQVIIGGQAVSLIGSGFATPFTVYFVQNGTWYSTSNTFRLSTNEIYASIPSGLTLGKATVVVNSGGEFSSGVELDVTRVPTATPVFSISPSAPSPGQQFSASLVGQQFFQERFSLIQGSSRYSALSNANSLRSALFTMPAHPFQPGSAKLEFKNHNSSASAPHAFTIPDRPIAPVLIAVNPQRSPEQVLILGTRIAGGFASVPQLNVAIFTQGNTIIEAPATTLSTGNLQVPIPASLSIGNATVRVRSTFANGTATSDPVSIVIQAPPATTSPTLTPVSVAPGARVTASGAGLDVFNASRSRNRVTVRSGGVDYPAVIASVDLQGSVLTFAVPEGLAPGAATVQIVSEFGKSSVTRLQAGILMLRQARVLSIVSGDFQTTGAGQPFAAPLAVKVTEADGTPIPNLSVTFVAPTSGTSGFFENGAGTTTSIVTDASGIATASTFKALNTGGTYEVRATIAAESTTAVFRLRNQNLAERRDLSLVAHGALSSETSGVDSAIRSGYVTASVASAPLAGISIFGVRDLDGNPASEAGVADATPSSSQLVFVDGRLSTYTGVALVNDNTSAASITFRLRNLAGSQIGDVVSITLEPRAQTARFFSQIFVDMPQGFVGTASITSQIPVAAVALRAVINDRGETIYSALPVAIASVSPPTGGEITFAHMAVGAGYRASIVLLNPTGSTMTGRLRFFDSSGGAATFGSSGSMVSYSIAPNSLFLLEAIEAADAPLRTGYAVAAADTGSPTPSGSILFGNTIGTTLIAEAGVPGSKALPRALLYVDTISTAPRVGSETIYYTGVAVVNRGSATARIRLLLRNETGEVLGIPITIELGPGKQTARFVDELLGSVAIGLRGSLEVASDRPLEMVTLRGAVGPRGEFLFTTLPIADYNTTSSKLLFAHFADGAGHATQTVVLNPSEKSAGATVSYLGANGAAVTVDLRK